MPSKPRITRRELVAAGVTGTALAAVPNAWAARLLDKTPRIGPGTFLDGVATGEPTANAVTFWSRLRTDRPRSGAELFVARDEQMKDVVRRTIVPTGQGIDGTLKARIGDLDPREEYFYQFVSGTDESPVGRTLTAPAAGSKENLRIISSSCQIYERGFFNALRDARTRVREPDLALMLGDYIYETASGPAAVRQDPIETTDLASYRAKFELYRSDPDLRELHRRIPMMHVWDDHDVSDNYNEPGAKRATAQQRNFAYRATFEWLPRMTMATERHRIYRRLAYGAMADVFLLDERQYREGDVDGRARRLLGEAQMKWLIDGLRASKATWKIIAQQVVVAQIPFGVGAQGQGVFNDDAWDGYREDRDRLLDAIDAANIDNVVFLTGDVHVFMANQLPTRFNELTYDRVAKPGVATEYVTGAVTNIGITQPERELQQQAPWNMQYDGLNKGYGVLQLGAKNLRTEFYGAPAYPTATTPVAMLQQFDQAEGTNQIERTTPASTGG